MQAGQAGHQRRWQFAPAAAPAAPGRTHLQLHAEQQPRHAARDRRHAALRGGEGGLEGGQARVKHQDGGRRPWRRRRRDVVRLARLLQQQLQPQDRRRRRRKLTDLAARMSDGRPA